jgi:hypothetical protein
MNILKFVDKYPVTLLPVLLIFIFMILAVPVFCYICTIFFIFLYAKSISREFSS